MSAVSEAREAIARSSEHVDDLRQRAQDAGAHLSAALELLKRAAGDSGHPDVVVAVHSFLQALAGISEAVILVSAGQEAADDYAENL